MSADNWSKEFMKKINKSVQNYCVVLMKERQWLFGVCIAEWIDDMTITQPEQKL